jgi:uncharacterized membrane protein
MTTEQRLLLLAHRANTLALTITLALIAVIALWQVPRAGWLVATLSTVPLWLTSAALLRHRPQARAWTTLCPIPYVCFGVMELIANPAARGWAAASVLLAFSLFTVLAGLLRMRPLGPALAR